MCLNHVDEVKNIQKSSHVHSSDVLQTHLSKPSCILIGLLQHVTATALTHLLSLPDVQALCVGPPRVQPSQNLAPLMLSRALTRPQNDLRPTECHLTLRTAPGTSGTCGTCPASSTALIWGACLHTPHVGYDIIFKQEGSSSNRLANGCTRRRTQPQLAVCCTNMQSSGSSPSFLLSPAVSQRLAALSNPHGCNEPLLYLISLPRVEFGQQGHELGHRQAEQRAGAQRA